MPTEQTTNSVVDDTTVDDTTVECGECGNNVEGDCFDSDLGCCHDCRDENYSMCESCEDTTHLDDARACDNSRNGKIYCDHCYHQEHTDCQDCGDSWHDDDLRFTDSGESFCESCHDERFTSCCGCCSEIDMHDETHNSNDNGIYCEGCWSDQQEFEEWDQDTDWKGCAEFEKIGSPRKFGIELETSSAPDCSEWAKGSGWGCKEDGSTNGPEFVSPILYGNDGYDSVMKFCNRLVKNDADIDSDCGYHVHLDLSDTTPAQRKAIALAYHYTRSVWESFTDKSRHDHLYAHRSTGSKRSAKPSYWDRKKIVNSPDKPLADTRYVWLNWRAFNRFQTVEVRSHEPTLDGLAVTNWVKAHATFIDYAKTKTVGQISRVFGSECPKTIMRELRFIWNDTELFNYYKCKSKGV